MGKEAFEMGKSKKKKKKSSSKAQYDAKKKHNSAAAKASDNAPVKDKAAEKESAEMTVTAAETLPKKAENELDTITKEAPVETKEEAAAEKITPAEPPMPAAPDVDIPYDPNFTEEDFMLSVSDLKAEDINTSEEKTKESSENTKKRSSKTSNIIQFSLIALFGTVAIVCLVMLGENIWGKIKGQALYSSTQFEGFTLDGADESDMRSLAYMGSDAPMLTLFERINAGKSSANEVTGGQYDQQLSDMKASLSALKAQNDDVYGWIYVPNSNINHPIVRCADNNYYLDHAYTGEYLPIGAIFADLTTQDLITDNYNTVIYGHNVVSTGQSSMFHDVEKFLDFEFFSTTKIYIYTMDGAFIYEPVSIYDTISTYMYFRCAFNTEGDFLEFAKEMVSNSNFNTGATFAPGDTMLTLSTCTNGAENGRYALHAKLVEVIK